MHNTFSDL